MKVVQNIQVNDKFLDSAVSRPQNDSESFIRYSLTSLFNWMHHLDVHCSTSTKVLYV